jgi:hypothetical protein
VKSLWQKIQQLEGLIDTKDVNAETNRFLEKVVRVCKERSGDTTWLTDGQVEWLDDIYERHFR